MKSPSELCFLSEIHKERTQVASPVSSMKYQKKNQDRQISSTDSSPCSCNDRGQRPSLAPEAGSIQVALGVVLMIKKKKERKTERKTKST